MTGLLRHIQACTNAVLPGGRVRLRLGPAAIGWVHPRWQPYAPLADPPAFDAYLARLAAAAAYEPRGELFDVRDEATGAVLATVDRGAVPLLGITAAGVHVNGLVCRADGLQLWVGERARDKKLDPGKLDHLVAGGIPAGHDLWSTLLKEAAEEAQIPAALAQTAVPRGSIGYAMERPEGLRRDRLNCFDLYLPEDFQPRPGDGEVARFWLAPVAEILARVRETDDFKFNVTLVLIDLFLRLGLIDPASGEGRDVAAAMAALRRG